MIGGDSGHDAHGGDGGEDEITVTDLESAERDTRALLPELDVLMGVDLVVSIDGEEFWAWMANRLNLT